MTKPESDRTTIIPLSQAGLCVHDSLPGKMILEVKGQRGDEWCFSLDVEDCHSLGAMMQDGAQSLIDANLDSDEVAVCQGNPANSARLT